MPNRKASADCRLLTCIGAMCLVASGAAPAGAAPPATSPLLEIPQPPLPERSTTVNDDGTILPDIQVPAPVPGSGTPAPDRAPTSDTASVAFDAGNPAEEGPGVDLPPAATIPPAAHAHTLPPATEARSDPAINPAGANVDSATMRRIAERLVMLNLLARADDAQDPALLAEALRAFQSASGIAPTGTLDRDTIGRLLS